METFHQLIEIAPRNSPRCQRDSTVARSDIAYTMIPSAPREMIGVTPEWHSPFAILRQQRFYLPIARVRLRIGNQQSAAAYVFDEAGSEPGLRLAAFNLKVDNLTESLVPVGRSPS